MVCCGIIRIVNITEQKAPLLHLICLRLGDLILCRMSFRPFIMLKHSSVGYHLGHGGFNSVIEALPSDYELVLLPFMVDQFLMPRS